MSARERAEALGWKPFTLLSSAGWLRPGVGTVVCCEPYRTSCVWRVYPSMVFFDTEDAALEHALLLRDVWLS